MTNFLDEIFSKLNENQKEEINVIESIVNMNKETKENTKEKLFCFLEKRNLENYVNFILGCIDHAAEIRPKERESHLFLVISIFNKFNLKFKIAEKYDILKCMLEEKNILHS